MLIQHTNQHINASVIVNQHVNPTHQPTRQCIFNEHVDSTYQPTRQCISKHQPICRLNTPTIALIDQSININQLVDSIQQLIADCASLHRMSIRHNQHVKTCAVHWVRSIEIYVFVNRNSITKLYAMEHSIERGMEGGGRVSWSVF